MLERMDALRARNFASASRTMTKVLIAGAPGVGKTTALRHLARALAPVEGFLTDESPNSAPALRAGLRAFDNRFRMLTRSPPRSESEQAVRYGDAVIEPGAFQALELDWNGAPAERPRIVDEIGPMQCLCTGFVDSMRALLASELTVIASVAQEGTGFIAAAKALPDVELWPMDLADRSTIVLRLIDHLGKRLPETLGGRTFLRAALARGATALHLALNAELGEGITLRVHAQRQPIIDSHNYFNVSRTDAGHAYSLAEAKRKKGELVRVGAGWFLPFLDRLLRGDDFSWDEIESAKGTPLTWNELHG